jgi:hypothetical protein
MRDLKMLDISRNTTTMLMDKSFNRYFSGHEIPPIHFITETTIDSELLNTDIAAD